MTKFMQKSGDRPSQPDSGASAAPEQESVTDGALKQDENQQQPVGQSLVSRLKHMSHSVIGSFTGPKPIYRSRRFWLGCLGVGVSGGAIALYAGWQALDRSVTGSPADALTYIREGTITIKAADNTIIQQIGPATRETLKIGEIPQRLRQAFISIEDRRFADHQGVDYQGIVRAAFSNLRAGGVVEGGSTITQQLARIVYYDQERSIDRKLKEMRMAQKLEEDLSKDQILERYLNLVYLGSGAYGVADAAWVYFSKTVDELTLPEMAMLAGLPPAPTAYSPFVNTDAAKSRRDVVLRRMQENGYITKAEAEVAMQTPLTTKRSNPKRLNRQAYYFTEYIQQELPKYVSKEALAQKGLTIETTLNLKWQASAEEAVTKTIEQNGRWQRFEQAALVAIDPRSGQIKAMVGGKDFYNQQFNRVTQAQRQPGSTFKTFVYGTAIAAGFSPYRSYMDAPFIVDGYEPKNYSEKFRGWLSIRDALISSVNVVAVKALIDIGWNPVIEIAQKMGIESKLHPTYSLALGASEVNLLELTSAYGTLATKGIHVPVHGIRRIRDRHGKVIFEAKVEHKRAIDEETAAIMTWMLRGVVTNGTGGAAQLGNRPVAGKTGTSDEARDLWFIGYIPQVVAGVWLGNDDNKPTWGSSSTAAYTWHEFMEDVVKDLEVEQFPKRPNQLEGRKGTIKPQRLRPKRTIDKKLPDAEQATNSSQRTSRNASAGEGTTEPQRRRRRRNSNNQAATTSNSSQRSPRQSSTNSSNQSSQPSQSRRQRSRRQASSQNTAPTQPAQTRRSTRRGASRVSNSAPAPAPRLEQKFTPAPAAAPPAPPASRKVPEAAPAPAAPPPEAPAPAVAE